MPMLPPVPAAPAVPHPMTGQPRAVLLKPLVTSPLTEDEDFSRYGDPDGPSSFETRNVLYPYGPERLATGKFRAPGEGVRSIMSGTDHRVDAPSAFPFPITGGPWSDHGDLRGDLPGRGDTVVGHDVRSGCRPTMLSGVRLGHGAIVAAATRRRRNEESAAAPITSNIRAVGDLLARWTGG